MSAPEYESGIELSLLRQLNVDLRSSTDRLLLVPATHKHKPACTYTRLHNPRFGSYSGTIHYIGTIHYTTHHLQDYWVLGQHSWYQFGPPCTPCSGTVALRANLLYRRPFLGSILYLCLFVCLFVCFYCTRGPASLRSTVPRVLTVHRPLTIEKNSCVPLI